ncbi:MAG: DUF1343 domain-containing protein [Deltaproteobacteria bacterium]|nr:DUF1343 domain-containing protein [Deltaproteobacteria bacterium]
MKCVETGLERLAADPPRRLQGKRLGLLANPASVDRGFRHARFLIEQSLPGGLKALFSPQHGFFAEKQDNMIASEDITDPELHLPVFSLYGQTRAPTTSMLDHIDTLIIDLQDVGTRVYTFIYTMALCMQALASHDKECVVLDRPNPLGGTTIEGNSLKAQYASFVGMYPIPMRHGLTIGEIARLFNDHFGIGCRLTVIPMAGWSREMTFSDTGLPWVAPSPNLPNPVSALVYPGQVLWEGTNVSEGRGTTQPFEIFGAPFFDTAGLSRRLNSRKLAGMHLRPLGFEPTSNKWQGQLCHGFQIHILDPGAFRPYLTTLVVMKAVIDHHRQDFQWKPPPYEYEFHKLPFDLISGDPAIRRALEEDVSPFELAHAWEDDLYEFDSIRKDYFIYR